MGILLPDCRGRSSFPPPAGSSAIVLGLWMASLVGSQVVIFITLFQ